MGARMRRSYPPGCPDHRMSTLARSPDAPVFRLDGQVALVTGAARGLGRSIALALAHAGADVALGLRDVTTGDELVADIEALGRRARPLQMDGTRRDEVDAAVAATVERFGRIDVLVNNAGGARMGAAL